MKEEMKKDYEASLNFWNEAYMLSEEEQDTSEIDADKDWTALAPSEKLLHAAASLGAKKKVLDYGCGHGWAGIIIAKNGCSNVNCVDVTANGIDMAASYLRLFQVEDQVQVKQIPADWLMKEEGNQYDGFFCSNVIDVVPEEIADMILEQAARSVTDDASIIIGMNHYIVPKEDGSRHISVKQGNHIYVNGILRMVSRTDEEWCSVLGTHFTVEKLEHFAWPGEEKETRRLFFLKKK